ncbi:unnamed protein product [Heligmosomoides polygyrus]|uniref:KTSC domain-containing protein n=1 Tax=Heligmosomoides polygyrus TaxID=6339 RepID=A0A183G3X9_HELPZ|nr:unnamed protein product [Heligmosomoides polygyrus]
MRQHPTTMTKWSKPLREAGGLEEFYKEDYTYYELSIGDFNSKIRPLRTPEELHFGTQGVERALSEFFMSTKTIYENSLF